MRGRDEVEPVQRELPQVAQLPEPGRQLDDLIVAQVQAVEGDHVADALGDAGEGVVREQEACQ